MEEVTHMLSSERVCHKVSRMCWNTQLGVRVVQGTCNSSQEARL